MALQVTVRMYVRGQVPTQNKSTLHELADCLCNELHHHDEKYTPEHPISGAEFAQFEAETATQGFCDECLTYAEAILGAVRLEVL